MSEALPEAFPASTSEVQLALCLVAKQCPDKIIPIMDKIYRGFWEEGDANVLTQPGFSPIFESELGPENAKRIMDEVRFFLAQMTRISSLILFNSSKVPRQKTFWMKTHNRSSTPAALVCLGLIA